MAASPFASFFGGGFECSSHRRRGGRRLELIAATGHDRHVAEDYRLLVRHGLGTARDGLRWHLIETSPGQYDWSSFLPMLRAARSCGLQVAWDLCHYGYPDGLKIWETGFVDRFASFAAAAARVVRDEGDEVPIYCPVNEISYWAWAGGTVGKISPCVRRRGAELKRQLVRCAVAAIEAIRAVEPRARFLHAEPMINIRAASTRTDHLSLARRQHEAQFEAWDMLTGRLNPELGGRPEYLDLCGLNYYPDNQWLPGGRCIPMGHHLYRPMRELMAAVHARYGRPLYIAETGAEGSARAAWLHYVCGEVRACLGDGVPVLGVCLYPVLAYPGWEDGRICETGLFSFAGDDGRRLVSAGVADELARQIDLFGASRAAAPGLTEAAA